MQGRTASAFRLSQEYGGKKIRFIAVSADAAKDRSKVEQFLSRNSLAMDIWVGADLDMLESAGLGNVLPATLILDERGEIVTRVMGEARDEDVRKTLEWLLGDRVGTPPPPIDQTILGGGLFTFNLGKCRIDSFRIDSGRRMATDYFSGESVLIWQGRGS